MARYISFPLETNPLTLLGRAYAYLQARMPGWTPAQGNLDTWMLEATSTELAELIDVASRVPDTIFRYFGNSILGINPVVASSATATTTWTARDTAGYTIPAGTQVFVRDASGQPVPFKTINAYTIPPGSSITTAGAIGIIAMTPGAASTGLGTPGGAVTLIDVLDFITTITLVAATSGGNDAETDAEYFNRLVGQIRLLARTPILPSDFSNILIGNIPGVYRAVALDGYNPTDDTFGNERMVTVVAIDQGGNDVSAPTKTVIDNYLEGLREINFDVRVMSPTYTPIDVTVPVKKDLGADTTIVHDAVVSAIDAYLDAGNWGIPGSTLDGSSDPHAWVNETVVRKYELATAINEVDGVDYINGALILAQTGDTLTEADVTLDGRVSLPTPGTITVTVT